MGRVSRIRWRALWVGAIGFGIGVVLVVMILALVYRPDRPVPAIAPGSSSGPDWVVQVIRPRAGLPLGGILPPQLFGLESELGFDASSRGASIDRVDARHVALSADGWELVLVVDAEGRLSADTVATFTLTFQDRPTTVRCRPAEPPIGTVSVEEAVPGELSGHFEIEVPRCEDATTATPLGWPPQPLVLRGSFDRLPMNR